MAQRTGTERFIASVMRIASAGGILALAIVTVLVVSGCGGDSETETASAPRSDSAANSAPGSGSSSDESLSSSDGDSAQSQGEGSSSGSGKRGPSIEPPEGAPEPDITPEQRSEATVANIMLSSPVTELGPGSVKQLPAAYTCDGRDSWPALRWDGVPADTAELVLFVLNLAPVEGELFYDWAVAGLDPSLDGLEAGRLPQGAIVGRNGFGRIGYSICPEKSSETFVFSLYAVPEQLSPNRGFDPNVLRKQVLDVSGKAGLMVVSYARAGQR